MQRAIFNLKSGWREKVKHTLSRKKKMLRGGQRDTECWGIPSLAFMIEQDMCCGNYCIHSPTSRQLLYRQLRQWQRKGRAYPFLVLLCRPIELGCQEPPALAYTNFKLHTSTIAFDRKYFLVSFYSQNMYRRGRQENHGINGAKNRVARWPYTGNGALGRI